MNVKQWFGAAALFVAVTGTAHAQVDLAGTWGARNEQDADIRGNSPGPFVVDARGIPLNDEGRALMLTWSPSSIGRFERQCRGYPQTYMVVGPFPLRIWPELDLADGRTVAWKIGAWEDRGLMTIWMDGRPRPSEFSPHSKEGFSTGTWTGDRLTVVTTHMESGYYRRNGAPISDRATLTTHFLPHENLLTVIAITDDPIYLAEPHVETKTFVREGAASAIGPPCMPGFEGAGSDLVHFLPDRNPYVDELTKRYGVPVEAAVGQPETLYPEFRKKVRR